MSRLGTMRTLPRLGRTRRPAFRTVSLAAAGAAALVAALPAGLPADDDLRLLDSRVLDQPADVAGPHAITRMEVDNDGPRVSVLIRHRRSDWRGAVTVQLRVPGEGRTRAARAGTTYALEVRHAPRQRRTLTTYPAARPEDAAAWSCFGARTRSRASERVTRIDVPRDCLDGAAKVAVTATASTADRDDSVRRAGPVAQQSQPNILMFMVDDMRADDLQYMPEISRRIGGQGVTFTNGMAPYPLCCPARASVLTGLYPHNHKVWSHLEPYGFQALDDSSTIATWLDDAGYRTSYLGKYLNGYGRQPAPDGSDQHSTRYVPPGWDLWRGSIDGGLPRDHPADGGTYRFFDTTLSNNGRGYVTLERQYQTRAFGRLTRKTVARDSEKAAPWFNYVSFAAPHFGLPIEADDPSPIIDDFGREQAFKTVARPNDVKGLFDDRIFAAPGSDWLDPDPSDRSPELTERPDLNQEEIDALVTVTRQRAESLHVVDQEIARILDVLERTGEAEETFVLFTSDNGYYLGEQGIRQGKTLPYEPALKVPMLVSGPGIPSGEVREDPFLSIDLASTLADMADVEPVTPVDGESLLTAARIGDQGWRRPVLVETGPASTVRRTDESGAPLPPDADPGKRDIRFLLGVRTPRYLYTHRATGFEELFDLRLDPRQYDNLVDADGMAEPGYDRPLAMLREQLAAVRSCDGEECSPPLPAALRRP